MNLAIVGMGLVSPAGLTPAEHVLYLRAGAVAPSAPPFVSEDGEPVRVAFCPWLGARMSMAERLEVMASTACEDALQGLGALGDRPKMPLIFCGDPGRRGLPDERTRAIGDALATRFGRDMVIHRSGTAGFFDALKVADALLNMSYAAAMVIAVDSFVSEAELDAALDAPPNPWRPEPPPPSEGAAALVLMRATDAREVAMTIHGVVQSADVLRGTSSDDDASVVDGAAMTQLLRSLPRPPVIKLALGPFGLDSLRQSEWQLSVARNAALFHPECELRSIENEIGRTGAAAGAMDFVYGLSVARHRATDIVLEEQERVLAWGISPDGTRGIAAASVRLP